MSRSLRAGTSSGRILIALCWAVMPSAGGCVGALGDGADGSSWQGEAGADADGSTPHLELGHILRTGEPKGPPGPEEPGRPACVYPRAEASFTVAVGSTLPESLHWQGFAEHSAAETTIEIGDYFDCDGSKGINAVLVDTSAIWCGSCGIQASELPQRMASGWAAKGIRILTLMIQDAQGNTATLETARVWREAFSLDSIAVAADPEFSMLPPVDTVALPLMAVVDPRTMKIVAMPEYVGQEEPILERLADSNKLP